jgi:hypothetical protein
VARFLPCHSVALFILTDVKITLGTDGAPAAVGGTPRYTIRGTWSTERLNLLHTAITCRASSYLDVRVHQASRGNAPVRAWTVPRVRWLENLPALRVCHRGELLDLRPRIARPSSPDLSVITRQGGRPGPQSAAESPGWPAQNRSFCAPLPKRTSRPHAAQIKRYAVSGESRYVTFRDGFRCAAPEVTTGA